jgi:hypothetical protein
MVKYNKVFRILALAVIFSLLMITLPAASALAAGTLTVSPTKVEIGDAISVTGSGYTKNTQVYIFISSQELDVGDDIEDLDVYYQTSTTSGDVDDLDPAEGEIKKSFDMPDVLDDGSPDEDVHPGTYYVYTTYSATGNIVAKDELTVRGIELDTSEGPVGTEVEIKGVGYDAREDITIKYDTTNITDDIVSGDEKTDSSGEFTCTVVIPESTAGDNNITVEDESNNEGKAVFTVEPALTISPTSGKVGDEVTVSGTGFGKSKDVTITFGNTDVATDETTSNKGSFEATFNVPSVGPGTYDVTAEDGSNNEASAEFRITTNISISPVTSQTSPGHVGTPVTISGTGFKANSDITITYTSEPVVFHITSGADGSFSYTFAVPPSPGGAHTITASDGTSSMQVTFFMESTSPPIPPPLLPLMGDKAKALAYFDWEDVKDDSMPVTYTLQIASDANFTTILLEKTGLTTSEYTLTEAEKLESTKKEAPYYWRLRAVDAAANASGWTTPGTFYVGFAFGFPELKGWVLYALMGAGGLVLFFLGLWVGRRRGGAEEY